MKLLLLSLLVILSACGKSVNNRVDSPNPSPGITPIFESGPCDLTFNNMGEPSLPNYVTHIEISQNLEILLPSFLNVSYFNTSTVSQLTFEIINHVGIPVHTCKFNANSQQKFQNSNCTNVLTVKTGDTLIIKDIPLSGIVVAKNAYCIVK